MNKPTTHLVETLRKTGLIKVTKMAIYGTWTTVQVNQAARKARAMGIRETASNIQRLLDAETLR